MRRWIGRLIKRFLNRLWWWMELPEAVYRIEENTEIILGLLEEMEERQQ